MHVIGEYADFGDFLKFPVHKWNLKELEAIWGLNEKESKESSAITHITIDQNGITVHKESSPDETFGHGGVEHD